MAKKVIAIYPGRFQPFGKHHYDSFMWLASKFGMGNTYIATTNKVDPIKSPLDFEEKKKVISKYGIGDKVVNVKNPYQAQEITQNFDPKDTAIVFMVGDKDMKEDPRFSMKLKRDGSPSYFEKYDPSKKLEGYDKRGYLVVAPHASYNIQGIGEMSGTNIRKALSNPKTTKEQFEDIFGWYDPKIEAMLKKKFSSKNEIASILERKAIALLTIQSLLLEGGKAIESIPVDKEDIKSVVQKAISALPKELQNKVQLDIGSSGYKVQSGDIDVFIDEDSITEYFKAKDSKEAKKKLEKHLIDQGYESKVIGRNVHIGIPYKNSKAQIDFMVIKDAAVVAPWHQHGPRGSYQDPEFKGSDIFILLNSIGKSMGLKFDAFGAKLLDRKSGEVVARDRDKVAKILLNKNATAEDLNSVKSILKALENDPKRDQKLAQAKEDEKKGLVKMTFKEEIIREDDGPRIQHPEDLIYWDGSKGAKRAIQLISKLAKDPSSISVKWDGSPAVVFGVDENGNFILTDKSGFTAKGYDGKAKSAKELEKIFKDRAVKSAEKKGTKPDFSFSKTMASSYDIFKNAFPKGVKGYFKGDVLYFTKPEVKNGEFIFKPNITTYRIPVNSELGKQIQNSKIGVVVHSFTSLDGQEKKVSDFKFNPKSGLLVMPPTVIKSSPKINTSQASSTVSSNAANADSFIKSSPVGDLSSVLYKFTNNFGGNLKDLNSKNFLSFVQKDATINPTKKQKITDYVRNNIKGLDSVLTIVRAVAELKNNVIAQLDSQDTGVKSSINGKEGGEGYVVSDKSGPIKLVNRAGFTAANRAAQR